MRTREDEGDLPILFLTFSLPFYSFKWEDTGRGGMGRKSRVRWRKKRRRTGTKRRRWNTKLGLIKKK